LDTKRKEYAKDEEAIYKNQPPAGALLPDRERRRQTTVRQPPAGALLPDREKRRQINTCQPPAGALRSRQEKKDLFGGFNPLND